MHYSATRRDNGTFTTKAPLDHTRPLKFSLTAEERDRLQAMADEKGITSNAIARQIIQEFISNDYFCGNRTHPPN